MYIKSICYKFTWIICHRDMKKAESAVSKLKAVANSSQNIILLHLDLADLASVETFAQSVKERVDKIHLLVNNAGRESFFQDWIQFLNNLVSQSHVWVSKCNKACICVSFMAQCLAATEVQPKTVTNFTLASTTLATSS